MTAKELRTQFGKRRKETGMTAKKREVLRTQLRIDETAVNEAFGDPDQRVTYGDVSDPERWRGMAELHQNEIDRRSETSVRPGSVELRVRADQAEATGDILQAIQQATRDILQAVQQVLVLRGHDLMPHEIEWLRAEVGAEVAEQREEVQSLLSTLQEDREDQEDIDPYEAVGDQWSERRKSRIPTLKESRDR